MEYIENIGFWQATMFIIFGSFGIAIFEILLEVVFSYFSGDDEFENREEFQEEQINKPHE